MTTPNPYQSVSAQTGNQPGDIGSADGGHPGPAGPTSKHCSPCAVGRKDGWLFYVSVFAVICLLALFSWSRRSAELPATLVNASSVEDAMGASAESGKPVLVFATADWCGPCQSFKRGTLADEKISAAIAQGSEFVKLDLTDRNDSESQRMAGMLGVSAIPAMVVIRDGAVVSRWSGRGGSFADWLDASGIRAE